MRARSVSFGAGTQHRSSPLGTDGVAGLGNDPPNYRLLLETDADIDAGVCSHAPTYSQRRR